MAVVFLQGKSLSHTGFHIITLQTLSYLPIYNFTSALNLSRAHPWILQEEQFRTSKARPEQALSHRHDPLPTYLVTPSICTIIKEAPLILYLSTLQVFVLLQMSVSLSLCPFVRCPDPKTIIFKVG